LSSRPFLPAYPHHHANKITDRYCVDQEFQAPEDGCVTPDLPSAGIGKVFPYGWKEVP